MPGLIVLCTDGSDHAEHALKAGLAIVKDPTDTVLVTVINPPDPSLVVGTGFASGAGPGERKLSYADLELDEDTRDVWRAGRLIELTPTEYKLLHYLLANAERVVSKAQILDHVWRYDFGGDARIVESYISMLRRKVDVTDPPLIHTLRGFGYSLRTPRP